MGKIKEKKILVCGAGGFIGHHLVKYLKKRNCWVRGVDIKRPEYEKTLADDFQLKDLRELENCMKVCDGVEEVIFPRKSGHFEELVVA